ncbi:MAG: hypothetical protein MR727_06170 [Lentisphaeria bacterium]|nr:hypothetical protein [Lentisphaeria bacterium]
MQIKTDETGGFFFRKSGKINHGTAFCGESIEANPVLPPVEGKIKNRSRGNYALQHTIVTLRLCGLDINFYSEPVCLLPEGILYYK